MTFCPVSIQCEALWLTNAFGQQKRAVRAATTAADSDICLRESGIPCQTITSRDTRTVTELDPALLAREGEGAVQVDLPTTTPLMVMLAGPIKVWWDEGMWDSEVHTVYTEWRDAVRVACIKAGHLVYSPHRAWQGAWSEVAQEVNDRAIEVADVMLDLTPPGVQADGTAAECAHAAGCGTPVVAAPPGDAEAVAELIARLEGLRAG
jgi:hypothetical protein